MLLGAGGTVEVEGLQEEAIVLFLEVPSLRSKWGNLLQPILSIDLKGILFGLCDVDVEGFDGIEHVAGDGLVFPGSVDGASRHSRRCLQRAEQA